MNESDAVALAGWLEAAFPGTGALVFPVDDMSGWVTPSVFRVALLGDGDSDHVLATFYDLSFGNRVIGMTTEPAARTER